jgi:hypothetical protein
MLTQPELPVRTETPLFAIKPGHPNIDWLIEVLASGEGEWKTAAEICAMAGKPANDQNKRWVRALADASRGNVAGGQRGYKLVTKATVEEYQHWRNWMNHQANEMKRRVIEADRVFYGRAAVESSPGMISPTLAPLNVDFAI